VVEAAQAFAQQILLLPTPVLTQLPLAHSLSTVHDEAVDFFFWHMPPIQPSPLAASQFALALPVVQPVAHAPETQRYPVLHACSEPVQVPELHMVYSKPGVEGQVLGVQVLCCSQPPLPSQWPLFPQAPEATAGQVAGVVKRGGPSAGLGKQLPCLVADNSQVWQPPAQNWSQQTPSEAHTNPVEQSLSLSQVFPAPCLVPQ
jgi:hypothetical protein